MPNMFNSGGLMTPRDSPHVVMDHSSALVTLTIAHFSPYQADNFAQAMQYGRHFVSNQFHGRIA